MACKRDAEEASTAVSALLHFCDEDQESLLEVLEDYFTSPVGLEDECNSDDDDTAKRGTAWYGIKDSTEFEPHQSTLLVQQVHYPLDPLQPRPIFLLTTMKCSIFGVHCEAIPRQVDFLGDEAGAIRFIGEKA